MPRSRRAVLWVWAAFALCASGLRAQGGTECCEVLQIPSAAFRPRSSTTQYEYLAPGYTYLSALGSQSADQLWAPVLLPTGARIQGFGLVYYDASGSDVTATLRAYNHGTPDTGGSPGGFAIATTGSSSCCGTGYSTVAADHTVLNDAAHDPNASQYVVLVSFPVADSDLGFKAVEIRWQRQVSPAPATASFNDVPTGDPAFAFIEALAGSGITAGCGGGNYCPDAPLTRRQMAVFIAKALGLRWPN